MQSRADKSRCGFLIQMNRNLRNLLCIRLIDTWQASAPVFRQGTYRQSINMNETTQDEEKVPKKTVTHVCFVVHGMGRPAIDKLPENLNTLRATTTET